MARLEPLFSLCQNARGTLRAFVPLFTCAGKLSSARVTVCGFEGKDNTFGMALQGKLNNLCMVLLL